MEMKVLNSSKDEIQAEIDSITIAEILRVYLNQDSNVSLAVWKREHPTKNPIILVRTNGKTAKKALDDAVSAITKDLNNLEFEFKKLK